MKISKFINGDENIANLSGQSFAMLFGEISPKIRTAIVITTVETDEPNVWSFKRFTKKIVPIEASAMFTMLFPISIVEISLSYCSES